MLIKLLLVPALVALITIVSRRWGLRISGVLTGLPMVAGPTLCLYAIEQGHAFAAGAARGAMLGVAATAAFCVAYAWTALRGRWPFGVVAGWAAFGAAGVVLFRVTSPGGVAEFALAIGGLLLAVRLLPPSVVLPPAPPVTGWDLPARMLAAAISVVVLTGLADWLGPQISGILSAFPVVTVILTVFTHRQRSGDAVTVFFRGLLPGLHTFAVFCLVFSAALGPFGLTLAAAMALALAAQIAMQVILLRRRPSGPAPATVREQAPLRAPSMVQDGAVRPDCH